MKLELYWEERDYLVANRDHNVIPTKEFCEEFIKRVAKGWELCPEEEQGGDHEDYRAWGYALYDDIDLQDEDNLSDINLFDWCDIYEQLAKNPNLYENQLLLKTLNEIIDNQTETIR